MKMPSRSASFDPRCPPLPLELVEHVASFAHSATDLLALQRVCKPWRSPCDRNSDWHRLALLRYPRLAAIAKALKLDLSAGGAKVAYKDQMSIEVPPPAPPNRPPMPTLDDFPFALAGRGRAGSRRRLSTTLAPTLDDFLFTVEL